MDAEMIRDYALAASGLLVPKIGGPSVKPYQPEGVWEAVAMIGSNTRDYKRGHGREPVPPQPVHVLEAGRPAGAHGSAQRPEPRDLHRPPRADEHAAAGAAHAERRAVRGSRPRAGREDAEGAAPTTTPGSTSSRSDCWPARSRREELADREGVARRRCETNYTAKPEEAKKLIAFGESKADATLDAGELAAWTMLVNQLMNLDEVLNK